MFSCEISF
jgi:hypothetical protein